MISTYGELAQLFGGCPAEDQEKLEGFIGKVVYKQTSCGAWVKLGNESPGVTFGSIVEGTDQCPVSIHVTLPCEERHIWAAIENIEGQAKHIWNQTHGCDHCWGPDLQPEDRWDVGRPVDPECTKCNGEGMVI